MTRIDRAFACARQENRAAFVGYLPAGYPSQQEFLEYAEALLEHADLLEVGLPYSDPLGDGPTIQHASERALAAGITTRAAFELIGELRASTSKPIAMMTYYNPIYCHERGEAGFLEDLAAAGADGLILPDLPPDEGEALIAAARKQDLDTVFLVAPTSTRARLELVTAACRGFIYTVSVTGVTGARRGPAAEVPALVGRVKEVSDLPVAVGFGVSSAETARPIAAVADGVVVGSALIAAIERGVGVRGLAQEIAVACRR